MRKIISLSVFGLFLIPNVTFAIDLNTAIQNTKAACSGIDDSLSDLKKMAGINTAVTAAGTVAGGVALGTGIAKSNVDAEQQQLMEKVRQLIEKKKDIKIEKLEIADEQAFMAQIEAAITDGQKDPLSADKEKIEELGKKSKTLGNVRTGTLAASTVANAAGTAIAATNKVDEDLEEKINKCISATKELSNAKLAAKVENTATDTEIANADKIINACRDYEFVDIKPINKRATGAAVSSGIGTGTGVVGTITSAIANTDKTRNGDAQREKYMNTAANLMSGATTVASAAATILNATQISAIKKVVTVAETCEGALK